MAAAQQRAASGGSKAVGEPRRAGEGPAQGHGHLLGATVTSEGIETVEEAERLTQLGTDAMQGYYFAKPCPAAELFADELVGSALAPDQALEPDPT